MPQLDSRPPKEQRPRSSDPNFNWRGIILFGMAVLMIAGAFLLKEGGYGKIQEIDTARFNQLLESGMILHDKPVEIVVDETRRTQAVRGAYEQEGAPSGQNARVDFRAPFLLEFDPNLRERLTNAGYQYSIKTESNFLAGALVSFLPFLVIMLLLYFFFRQQIRMAGKGALNFGKSKARMLSREKNKITFKDVAGVEEAKDEVEELVEFLKDPKKFQ